MKVEKDDYLQIMSTQAELIEDEIKNLENQSKWIRECEDIVKYLFVLQSKLSDKIYSLFGVENEDILAFYSENIDDEEIQKSLDTVEEKITQLTTALQNFYM